MRFLYFIVFLFVFQDMTAQSPIPNQVIAHRGAWKVKSLPQNSLASLEEANHLGCFGSEFDVRMTADNQLIVVHDEHHGELEIEKTYLKELQNIKLSNGENVPLLSEYLNRGIQLGTSKLILEIKPTNLGPERALDMVRRTMATVKRCQAQTFVTYISFDIEMLKTIVDIDPTANCQYLMGDLAPTALKELGINGFDYHLSILKKHPDWISEGRSLGMTTNAWTVNEASDMDYLFHLGIDYITTDQPSLAFERSRIYHQSHWKLKWSDEFPIDGLPNDKIWTYDIGGHGWGNQELQYYTDRDSNNVQIRNGFLHITARKEVDGPNQFTSTRLITRGLKSVKYGKIEARIKLPSGRGMWPAFWTLGENIDKVGWSACGELDIMEHVGFDPDTIVGSIHTSYHNHLKGTQKTKRIKISQHYDEFHLYGVAYDEQKVEFLFDDQVYYAVQRSDMKDWPFDGPMFLLLNVAVGGTWGGQKGVDESIFPQTMVVDFVRVYDAK